MRRRVERRYLEGRGRNQDALEDRGSRMRTLVPVELFRVNFSKFRVSINFDVKIPSPI